MVEDPGPEVDGINAHRLFTARALLHQLALARQSPRCDTVEKVRIARASTVKLLQEVMHPDWRPPESGVIDPNTEGCGDGED